MSRLSLVKVVAVLALRDRNVSSQLGQGSSSIAAEVMVLIVVGRDVLKRAVCVCWFREAGCLTACC